MWGKRDPGAKTRDWERQQIKAKERETEGNRNERADSDSSEEKGD